MEQERIEHAGFTIVIHSDEDPMNPRTEWDNVATMVCWHSRYNLGDEHDHKDTEAMLLSIVEDDDALEEINRQSDEDYDNLPDSNSESWDKHCQRVEELDKERLQKIHDLADQKIVMLPLYLYDHSGITMNTGGYHCPWDSGQVGWIYVEIDKALKEWGGLGGLSNAEQIAKIEEYLKGEVKTYDDYLTGQVYGYVVEDEDGNHIDSCWGFFGYPYDEYMLSEAKALAERARDNNMIGAHI